MLHPGGVVGAGVEPIREGGEVSLPEGEAEHDLAARIFHDGFIEPLPVLAARLDELRGVLVRQREVQTKAPGQSRFSVIVGVTKRWNSSM